MSEHKKDNSTATPPVVRLASAEVDVVAARDRLSDTVARLQSRLDPKVMTQRAVDEAKTVGRDGADYARENPGVVGGAAAVVGLYLIRRPLAKLFRRRKGPKPQKAAKPMTAIAPTARLALRAHPTQASVVPNAATAPSTSAGNGVDATAPVGTQASGIHPLGTQLSQAQPHATSPLPSDAMSNQGSHIKEPIA
jgi:hypothetical protein